MTKKKTQKSKNKEENKKIPFIAYFPWVFLIIILVVALYYPAAQGNIVARVNGEPITLEEIDRLYNALAPEEQAVFTKSFLLNATINEKLLLQAAKEEGVTFSDEEVEKSAEAYIEGLRVTKEQYLILLGNQGVDYEDFLEDYKKQLVISTLITTRITLEIEVSDEEAKAYYDAHVNEYIAPKQVQVAHILLASESEAEEVLQELEDGADLEALAKEKSLDPSAQTNGGVLPYAPKGIFVPEFEDYIFDMEAGDIGIVESQFGFHVVKFLDEKPPFRTPFEDAKKDVKGKILAGKQSEYLSVYLGQLRDTSRIEIMNIK